MKTLLVLLILCASAQARTPILTGIGIVKGSTPADPKLVQKYAKQLGLKIGKDYSLCMVTAKLPKPGEKLTFKVSTLDGAKVLKGKLLPTKLRGCDREVYAIVAGKIPVPKKGNPLQPTTVTMSTLDWEPSKWLPSQAYSSLSNWHPSRCALLPFSLALDSLLTEGNGK